MSAASTPDRGSSPDNGRPGQGPETPFTVSRLNRKLARTIDDRVPQVWVTGEVGSFKTAPSGNAFFSLKDRDSELSCIAYMSAMQRMGTALTNGAQVVALARVMIYQPRGQLQLEIREARPTGVGLLHQRYAELKARLQAEGLFSRNKKRRLPRMPRRIALVTSPAGAAVRDMIRSIHARWPATLLVVPVGVQGAQAAREIAWTLRQLQAPEAAIDLIVVGRGGGSLEDLWAFNEEELARAIVASRIPIVSAVGHEVDRTIADLVADRAVATPTAVGEVMPDKRELLRRLDLAGGRLGQPLRQRLRRARQHLDGLARRRVLTDPLAAVRIKGQRIDELTMRLQRAQRQRLGLLRQRLDQLARRPALVDPRHGLARRRERLITLGARLTAGVAQALERARGPLERAAAKLDALSPLRVLARGYSLTQAHPTGALVRKAAQLAVGDSIRTRLEEGWIESTVTRTIDTQEGA